MLRYRLSDAAQADVISILAWTQEQFGEAARLRYESLIAAALRDVAMQPDRPGSIARPELGVGVRSWHLRLSRGHIGKGTTPVRRPRHFLIYRLENPQAEGLAPQPPEGAKKARGGPSLSCESELLVLGRVLHEAMELARHLNPETAWE